MVELSTHNIYTFLSKLYLNEVFKISELAT